MEEGPMIARTASFTTVNWWLMPCVYLQGISQPGDVGEGKKNPTITFNHFHPFYPNPHLFFSLNTSAIARGTSAKAFCRGCRKCVHGLCTFFLSSAFDIQISDFMLGGSRWTVFSYPIVHSHGLEKWKNPRNLHVYSHFLLELLSRRV